MMKYQFSLSIFIYLNLVFILGNLM